MKITIENLKVGNTVIGKITADNVSLEKLVEIIDEISTSVTNPIPQEAATEEAVKTDPVHEELLKTPEPQEQTLEGFWDDIIERIPGEFSMKNITSYWYRNTEGKNIIEISLSDNAVVVGFVRDSIYIHIRPGAQPKLYCNSMPSTMYGRYLDSLDIPDNIKEFLKMIIIIKEEK